MQVISKGNGSLDGYVIVAIHGDELCGPKAIESIISDDWIYDCKVEFIIANEKALENKTRYIDKDLNRSFLGDLNSDKYEERLARKISNHIRKDLPCLSIHSTVSYKDIFALSYNVNSWVKKIVYNSNSNNLVGLSNISHGSLCDYNKNTVEIECGIKNKKETFKNAEEEIKRFLNVLQDDIDKSPFTYYTINEKVPMDDSEFLKNNFEKVEKGERYAKDSGEDIIAKEDFYPILMSDDGYDDIIGFKGSFIKKYD